MKRHGAHTKSYTPTSITAALSNPSSLSADKHVIIGPVSYRYDESSRELKMLPEPWDPLQVLYTLEHLPNIISISVDLDYLMFHSFESETDALDTYFEGPEDTLEFHCSSLCKWLIPSLPKTTIQHFPVRELVHESSKYNGDKAKWKAFVAEQGPSRPELMAFDYTSEGHGQNLDNSNDGPFISLGLFG